MSVDAEFVITLGEPLLCGQALQGREVCEQCRLECGCGTSEVIMCAAEWLGNDFVDQSQFLQIFGSDLQGFRSFCCRRTILPENRRATFRTDDGVIRILQNQDAISDADTQRAAGTTFA